MAGPTCGPSQEDTQAKSGRGGDGRGGVEASKEGIDQTARCFPRPIAPDIGSVLWIAIGQRTERGFLLDIIGRNSYTFSMNTIVSEKGQVTIPKPLRERLGIRPGQILDFNEEHGRLVVTKVTPRDPVEALYGILKLERSTDDAITSIRGRADAV